MPHLQAPHPGGIYKTKTIADKTSALIIYHTVSEFASIFTINRKVWKWPPDSLWKSDHIPHTAANQSVRHRNHSI